MSHLFVYGTLMSSASGPMGTEPRARLHRESRSLGTATMPGRLVDLGAYPGLIAPAAAAELVHGEALALGDAAATWPWLDAYEGMAPDGEYSRELRPARLDSGATLDCHVYVFIGAVGARPILSTGRWRSVKQP
jgi:gamma-glutamylcyclotransferase (GGCT)/AIG2-like uncharacterized protein YtfP